MVGRANRIWSFSFGTFQKEAREVKGQLTFYLGGDLLPRECLVLGKKFLAVFSRYAVKQPKTFFW